MKKIYFLLRNTVNMIFISRTLLWIAVIFTIISGSYAVLTFHKSVEYGITHDTYKYLTEHLADDYPAISIMAAIEEPTDAQLINGAKEFQDFLLEVYACIKVGACSREASLKFICANRKLSNALSLSSGIVIGLKKFEYIFKMRGSLNDTLQKTLRNQYKKNLPHMVAILIFDAILNKIDEFRSATPDVPERCDSILSDKFTILGYTI